MKILVVGAGAVGGYFGAKLAQAGREVTFLVRKGRAETLRKNGLQVAGTLGDFSIQPKLILTGELTTHFDLILLSVKAYALEAAMNDFAPAVGPSTIILPLLNGMSHLEVLTARFGADHVIGGAALISSSIDEAGRIELFAPIHGIRFGELKGGTSERTKVVDETLKGAGFDVYFSENVMQGMWEKWIMLASMGAVNCLFRGDIGEVNAAPGGTELALRIVDECAAISAANAYPPSDKALAFARLVVSNASSKLMASMYRDMMSGGPVEADHIVGDLIERGRKHGVPCPLLQAAYVSLCVYQNRLPVKESA